MSNKVLTSKFFAISLLSTICVGYTFQDAHAQGLTKASKGAKVSPVLKQAKAPAAPAINPWAIGGAGHVYIPPTGGAASATVGTGTVPAKSATNFANTNAPLSSGEGISPADLKAAGTTLTTGITAAVEGAARKSKIKLPAKPQDPSSPDYIKSLLMPKRVSSELLMKERGLIVEKVDFIEDGSIQIKYVFWDPSPHATRNHHTQTFSKEKIPFLTKALEENLDLANKSYKNGWNYLAAPFVAGLQAGHPVRIDLANPGGVKPRVEINGQEITTISLEEMDALIKFLRKEFPTSKELNAEEEATIVAKLLENKKEFHSQEIAKHGIAVEEMRTFDYKGRAETTIKFQTKVNKENYPNLAEINYTTVHLNEAQKQAFDQAYNAGFQITYSEKTGFSYLPEKDFPFAWNNSFPEKGTSLEAINHWKKLTPDAKSRIFTGTANGKVFKQGDMELADTDELVEISYFSQKKKILLDPQKPSFENWAIEFDKAMTYLQENPESFIYMYDNNGVIDIQVIGEKIGSEYIHIAPKGFFQL